MRNNLSRSKMKVVILFVLLASGVALDCLQNQECKSCIAHAGCRFTIHLNGKTSCEKEEQLDSLALKRAMYSESDCGRFFKEKRLPRAEKVITGPDTESFVPKANIAEKKTHIPSIRGTSLRKPPPPTTQTTSPKNLSTVLPSPIPAESKGRGPEEKLMNFGNLASPYNCSEYKGDLNENLTRSLCRTAELIGKNRKEFPLSKDLTVMMIVNPMNGKKEECRVLKWRKNNCRAKAIQ